MQPSASPQLFWQSADPLHDMRQPAPHSSMAQLPSAAQVRLQLPPAQSMVQLLAPLQVAEHPPSGQLKSHVAPSQVKPQPAPSQASEQSSSQMHASP